MLLKVAVLLGLIVVSAERMLSFQFSEPRALCWCLNFTKLALPQRAGLQRTAVFAACSEVALRKTMG